MKNKIVRVAFAIIILVVTTGYIRTHWTTGSENNKHTNNAKENTVDNQEYYIETPRGLESSTKAKGISKENLAFLKQFRKKLIAKDDYSASSDIAATLRSEILTGATKSHFLLARYNLTPRQELLAYTMLRVNGSFPTYAPRTSIPRDITTLLLGTSGNCSDFSVRLMLALEVLGLHPVFISNVTPAIPGHVFVDVYDCVEDTAYLLDATFNTMIMKLNANGSGLINSALNLSDIDRKNYIHDIIVIDFPVYLKFVDPGEFGFADNALTADFINEQRDNRQTMWRQWLKNDFEKLCEWWIKAPNHRPMTTLELKEIGIIDIPNSFSSRNNFSEKIRIAAKISDTQKQ